MVRFGLVIACRLAGSPTSRSPLSVNATTLGVSRFPSWLGMTLTSLPSITATTELVVPRSMPMIFSPLATLVLPCVISPAPHEPERPFSIGKLSCSQQFRGSYQLRDSATTVRDLATTVPARGHAIPFAAQ